MLVLVDKLVDTLIEYIGLSGWLFVIIIVIVLILNPEKVFLWRSSIASLFVWISSKARKVKIGDNIRGNIIKATKTLAKENQEIMPYDLKIEWVKNEDLQTFLDNNQVIVRMSHTENPQRNVTFAATEYVKKGLMPKARKYIDEKVKEATDLTMVRKLISIGWNSALDYYDSEVLNPIINSDAEIKGLVEELIILDNNGMLISILLNEYVKIGNLIYPEIPNDDLIKESKDLVKYLLEFAKRERGELIKEHIFNRKHIKIKIQLAVKKDITEEEAFRVHLRYINQGLKQGIETFYIMALGENCNVAVNLAKKAIIDDNIISDYIVNRYTHKFDIRRKRKGVCIELRASNYDNE